MGEAKGYIKCWMGCLVYTTRGRQGGKGDEVVAALSVHCMLEFFGYNLVL